MARRLGLLGPILVVVGVVAAVAGAWYFRSSQPKAGAVIDTIPIDAHHAFVIRAEQGGERSFLELRDGDHVRWQAYIPHYAGAKGRPAIAWSPDVVTVRVERDGRAEVFAFRMDTAVKVGGFQIATEHEPIHTQPQGPITLTDHVRSFELVGGPDWHQMVAVTLKTGRGAWKVDLGPAPIQDGGVQAGPGGEVVWLAQGGHRRTFDAVTGRELTDNALN